MKFLSLAAAASLATAAFIPEQNPMALLKEKPLVTSEELQKHISEKGLRHRAEHLFKLAEKSENEFGHPTRVIGSEGHRKTLKYIIDSLKKFNYYHLSMQPFDAVAGNVLESKLVIGGEVPKSSAPFSLTPGTPDREPVYGNITVALNEGCDVNDFENVKGTIVLVRRGTCPFGDKSANAGKRGAIACVIYDSEPGDNTVSGTLGEPNEHHVATFGISNNDGVKYIEDLANKGHLEGSAYVDGYVKTVKTYNILAETIEGDPENVVCLGAHSDSVTEGPGINDDGSGTISLLETAIALTNFKVKNKVRFAWWAAEEEGLLGSNYYANNLTPEENQQIRLFMDYDMMASPNYAYQIYDANNKENPEGSEELKQLYIDFYEREGLNYTFIPFDGRSDYVGFIDNGIPGGGIATGAEGVKTDEEVEQFGGKAGDWYDPCYHQLCDDLSNPSYEAWLVNTKLIAHSVGVYAESFKGFPKRKEVKKDTVKVEGMTPKYKYKGHSLVY
ncbi:hypothetical protein B0I72DRAFT_135587 [Yarrowia lipolytica]|jgi:aminopeptidase Y|nr:hypothetical protein BKA91DRAFT_136672 [Yarrowia lipolytica]KAE8173359.1 hypothetical protein BKA90DRAFT_135961 [Yarrowia lipolytica]QNP96906.1 Aminopeptidase Y [Yarrowia lipolytica]RDW33897.1 hypothetical protein B0I72DRAFT_135587 [Yarrowia lipolytica]RMI95712.1 hypothetical protein BD777DRAFT_129573 [Yarrowia lipolytica]